MAKKLNVFQVAMLTEYRGNVPRKAGGPRLASCRKLTALGLMSVNHDERGVEYFRTNESGIAVLALLEPK